MHYCLTGNEKKKLPYHTKTVFRPRSSYFSTQSPSFLGSVKCFIHSIIIFFLSNINMNCACKLLGRQQFYSENDSFPLHLEYTMSYTESLPPTFNILLVTWGKSSKELSVIQAPFTINKIHTISNGESTSQNKMLKTSCCFQ